MCGSGDSWRAGAGIIAQSSHDCHAPRRRLFATGAGSLIAAFGLALPLTNRVFRAGSHHV
jgi:hypothetical protein